MYHTLVTPYRSKKEGKTMLKGVAFPTCVSVNHCVCSNSPPDGDSDILKQGDVVKFTLPTVYKLTRYTGVDQIQGYEGKRFALSVGPIVLGCVGAALNTTTPYLLLSFGFSATVVLSLSSPRT